MPRNRVEKAEPAGDVPSRDFAERYRRYFPQVFAYIYGRIRNAQATEDLASEVFKKAFDKAHTLRQEEAFRAWLFTIARNVLISHWRRESRLGLPADYQTTESLPSKGVMEEDVLKRQTLTRITDLLGRFPLREQDIVALKFDAELTNAQIAQVMGLSESNVGIILYRTLRKLRRALEREG